VSVRVPRKHQRIAAVLAQEIKGGVLRRGTRMPGEVELARRFNVSRGTIRSALAELNDAGLITTHTGRGSFVLFDGHALDNRLGWAHALAARGIAASVRTLRLEIERDAPLAKRLGLPFDEFVVIERVRRLASGAAISYEYSRIPPLPELRALAETGLPGDSLTETLRHAGLIVGHGQERVRGHALSEGEATALGRAAGEFFLQTVRTSWSTDGTFVEHVDSLLDPAHFELDLLFTEEGA
jgi:GntR family transcriptional regulator